MHNLFLANKNELILPERSGAGNNENIQKAAAGCQKVALSRIVRATELRVKQISKPC